MNPAMSGGTVKKLHTSTSIIATLLIFLALFFLKGFSIDPDFGWHLQTGRYILQHGIPKTDPFSYSMPSYPILDHEWLTDVVTAITFRFFGMSGLAVIFAAIATISLWIQIPKRKTWTVFSLLLSDSILLFAFGVRPQVVSWLLFSLVLLLLRQANSSRYVLLPLVFLLWANMHASFPLGLLALLTDILVRLFSILKTDGMRSLRALVPLSGTSLGRDDKRVTPLKLDAFLAVVCFLVTFINPYGMRIWQEVFLTIFQPGKAGILTDWYPGVFVPFLPMWILIGLSAFFLFRFYKVYSLFEKILFIALLFIGMAAIVDTPYWALFVLPLTVRGFTQVEAEKGSLQFLRGRTFKVCTIIIIFFQGILLFHSFAYPTGAVTYLRKHPPIGNIFSDFNWSGYVLWQLPEKKIFLDGQMTNWKQLVKNNHESSNALLEYLSVIGQSESLSYFTKKYKITTILLPYNFTSRIYSDVSSVSRYPELSRQLNTDKWHLIYKDVNSVIYQNN